jgi:uncharacterized protein (TIGR03435 family)
MKKWLLSFGVVVALLTGSLRAQDITGIWQGTLSLPGPNGQTRDVRAQIRIENSGASMKATLRMIDQGPGVMPATATLQGSAIKITIPGMGGSYDGRLIDATTMEGNLRQPGAPVLKLDLKKVTEQAAWVPPPAPPRPAAMPADWKPAFEVATIKPSEPGTPGQSITVRGRTFATHNQTVAGMMTFAFGLHPDQIVGGPQWMKDDRFEITAEPEGTGFPNDKQLRAALAKLLADRFNLTFHRDKKELTVYALTMLKTGHKLTPNDNDPNGLPGLFFRGLGIFPVRNATMGDFTGTMQAVVLDRPVVDKTGIQGRYDFTLTWTPDETQFGGRGGQAPPPADPANAPPGLFTAIQEQLGLKLEATKATVEVFVIDRLEKPTAN